MKEAKADETWKGRESERDHDRSTLKGAPCAAGNLHILGPFAQMP